MAHRRVEWGGSGVWCELTTRASLASNKVWVFFPCMGMVMQRITFPDGPANFIPYTSISIPGEDHALEVLETPEQILDIS